ncbi:hypothetical protein Tco_0266852 [Tanacetum coccineum]
MSNKEVLHDAAADDNAKATSVHDDVGVPDVVTDDNANATSVCDDINEADAGTDDNAKATSVHDDVGVPDAAADDNAKATSVCDDINKADAAADDNVKATSVHDDVGVPDASADDNAKATSVHDDVGIPDVAANDNAKATSVHDDVGVPDAAADDNAKDTSVCDDINQADAASYDNAKVPLSDVYNTLVDNENVLMKDAHEINNHIDPPIHGFQIMLWGGLDEGKANRKDTKPEVTVVKKTRKKRMSKRQRELPTSTRRRSKRHIQEVVLAVDNGDVVKETQLPDSHEDVFQPRTSKRMKKETLLSDWPPVIRNYLKEIHITRWEEIQAWGNPVWTGVSDVLLPDPVLKHDIQAWVPELVLKHVVPFMCELWVPTTKSALNLRKLECLNCMFLAEKIKALETKIKILEATLEMERHLEKERTTHDRRNNRNVKCQDEEQISILELEYRIEKSVMMMIIIMTGLKTSKMVSIDGDFSMFERGKMECFEFE